MYLKVICHQQFLANESFIAYEKVEITLLNIELDVCYPLRFG